MAIVIALTAIQEMALAKGWSTLFRSCYWLLFPGETVLLPLGYLRSSGFFIDIEANARFRDVIAPFIPLAVNFAAYLLLIRVLTSATVRDRILHVRSSFRPS